MKILLPVDGTEYTSRMLAHLATNPQLLRGDHNVLIFTVIEPTALRDTRSAKGMSMEDMLREHAEPVLEPVRLFAREQGWNVETDYVPGSPVQAIVAKAEVFGADLIVMGTRGRSPLGAFVLGSVANGVLGSCKVPLMLIR